MCQHWPYQHRYIYDRSKTLYNCENCFLFFSTKRWLSKKRKCFEYVYFHFLLYNNNLWEFFFFKVLFHYFGVWVDFSMCVFLFFIFDKYFCLLCYYRIEELTFVYLLNIFHKIFQPQLFFTSWLYFFLFFYIIYIELLQFTS